MYSPATAAAAAAATLFILKYSARELSPTLSRLLATRASSSSSSSSSSFVFFLSPLSLADICLSAHYTAVPLFCLPTYLLPRPLPACRRPCRRRKVYRVLFRRSSIRDSLAALLRRTARAHVPLCGGREREATGMDVPVTWRTPSLSLWRRQRGSRHTLAGSLSVGERTCVCNWPSERGR